MTIAYDPPDPPKRMSLAEYFDYASAAVEKQEYRDGEVVAMSGGTARHSLIITNLSGELHGLLKGSPCAVYDSNLRIRTLRPTVYSYPDMSIICGELKFDTEDSRGESVINPTVVAEVISPSTEVYDRGKKFNRYLAIDTLRDLVIVEQDQPHIGVHSRGENGEWIFRFATGLNASIRIESLNIDLPLRDVYDGVKF